ncbi:response regulator [Adlercreutzia equolifaciens]|uniref:hybrid sensor histidine kinase/response regulator n=2 Tax=Adlercreutzia TaxID=447020 RepID=UPI0023B0168A|nr:hybrid sensor histidine kinase/response regulator [Adlercreutzia equolifaciens]MDE8702124.1 response regulator [Adlercreutzia equolifaciens]
MSSAETRRQTRNLIIAALVAVAVLIGSLFLFTNANTDRIVAQNSQYLESSSGQTARRVDDVFTTSLRTVQTAASIYENTLTNGTVDPQEAVNVLDLSQFDHTFFITPDGIAYNRDGRTAEAFDRYYYTAGIAGESGMCFIDNAIFDGQNVVAFFAPVHYEDQVAGVMVSVYREDTLTDLMTTQFYGDSTPTYLCLPDGTIISQAPATEDEPTNIDEVFSSHELDGITLSDLDSDIASGNTASFTYRTPEGVGNTYMMKLPSYDWVLVRSFPASITNGMISKANISGTIVIAGVLIAAAVVVGVLMAQARRKNIELLLERQEATRIIDASTNLFNSLVSVDLVHGTYEYLKNEDNQELLPSRGTYDQLCAYLKSVSASDAEDNQLVLLDTEAVKAALGPDTPFIQQDWKVNRGDEVRWHQVSTLSLARNAAGEPTDVLVTVQDITDAKEQEIASRQALEDAFQAAEHASQAKSDFLNSMSHDIRTPMNSIMGLTAIAGMHVNDPERVRECLGNITSASKHLLGLINEVLDMAKIESGTIGLSEEPFDLPESIENLITIMNPQIAAKGQILDVQLVDIKHEHVIGDPTRLQQVFVNIMGNSIKFTPEGGTIGLRITELQSRIPGSGCYEFVFSDTGCGMSPEFLKTVFDPFTRANDSRTTKVEGTGLGMAIVKSVVTLMSGSIDVASVEGEGTTFTVVVHLKLRDGEREDLSDLEGIRVLVVDDDAVACEGACILLDDIGMRSAYELSGQAGIDAVVAADTSQDPFRAVILDWRMPEMSGLEAAKRIREVTGENVPIIILSAYDWSMIEQEAREVGVDAFISKPLFRSRLVQVMKELLTGEVHTIIDEKAMLEGLTYEGRRVLLTEDNMMAAAIAEELIGMTGAAVEHAENGKLALDMLLERDPGYYDIVLMDIQMPVMNGYEAATAIRAEAGGRPDLGDIPIVALSADAFAEDIRHAHASGMNDHMSKPLEIETLVRMLQKWMH